MSTLQYQPHIDGLRALAVGGVVIYHVIPSHLPGGYLGVDVFFVISGYLISFIVFGQRAADRFSFADFYARRIRRLFPSLIVVLLLTMVVGAFALFADEYERLGKHAASAIIFLLNFRLMNEAGYFDVVSESKPLLHLWSLSVEEQFYLVWPALLVVLGRLRWHTGLVIGILFFSSFAFAVSLAEWNPDTLFFHPLARFWELLAGAALAYRHQNPGGNILPFGLNGAINRHLLSLAGLISVLSSFVLFSSKMNHPGGYTLLPLLGATALIASGGGAIGNRALSLRPLVWIGLISYPLYLWHWPILSYLRIMESGVPTEAMLWSGAGCALLLAGFTYKFIEQPLRRSAGSRYKLIALGGSMIALFIASRAIVATQGLPDRSVIDYIKVAETQMKREPRQDQSCLSLFPEGNAPVYCRQHNPGERMITITGDSHAHTLFPGVSSLAAQRGYGTLLLANSGCPPFEGAVTGRNALEKSRCSTSIETILNAIQQDTRIKAVIIASRGPIYLNSKGFGPVEAGYNYPPISERASINGATETAPIEVFRQGLDASLLRLHQHGLRVAYLLQVPELGVPARDCLCRPLTLTRGESGCTVAFAVYRERMHPYRSMINELRVSRNFLKIVDPEPYFCDAHACSGFRDNQLLYADDDHLSVLGSIRLAPAILQALDIEPRAQQSIIPTSGQQ